MKPNFRAPRDDGDCEVVYDKSYSPVKNDVLIKVTKKLATEGLEIIEEVPRRTACNKKNSDDECVDENSFDEFPSSSEESEDDDSEWRPSSPGSKKEKPTKRQRKAGNFGLEENGSAPSKKPRLMKSSSTPRKPGNKVSGKKQVMRRQPNQKGAVNETSRKVGAVPKTNAASSEITSKEIMMVPYTAVCHVIGKKHAMIRRIESDTGARVIFPDWKDRSPKPKVCIVTGTQIEVQAACAFIHGIINSISDPRDRAPEEDVEVVKELRSSFVQTSIDEEQTETSGNNVEHTFTSNTNNSTEMVDELPLYKRLKLDPEAGPSNVNTNTVQKKKKKDPATKRAPNGKKMTTDAKKKKRFWKKKSDSQKLIQKAKLAVKRRSALKSFNNINTPVNNTVRKIKEEEPFSENILSTGTRDECETFAQSVASELKKIKNEYELQVAKFKINEILFLATTGNLLNNSDGCE